jgi:hypothetical protein
MTDARTKQIQEIEGLLAERRKYELWLAQLDARKESTPSNVFAKVHGDYTARLGEAQQKLSSESGAVHALATELEDSLARQERQIAERADERAEAELRASVGEFAGKEWEKLRGRLDSAIADLSGERESIQRELDTLRALLSEAEPAAGVEPKRDIDDIAFLRSVLGRSTPYSSTPAPVVSAPPPAPEPPERPEVARASMPARASGAATARASTSAAGAPARQSAPELFATPEVPEGPSGPRGTDDEKPNRPSGTFGRATPRTTEAVKSLKCQECGTLNYPTEWYCERCGGELAAF